MPQTGPYSVADTTEQSVEQSAALQPSVAPTPPSTALPPPPSEAAGKLRMLGPNGMVYSVPSAQAKQYEEHGYSRYAGPTIDEGSIEAKFGGWRNQAKAAGLGAVNQVPLLDKGLEAFAPDTAHSLAEATRDARAEHPIAYGAGSLGGAVATFAAGGAVAKGVLGAAGLAGRLAAASEASPLIAAAAKGALGNAAFNVADQIDSAALEHALSPEGQEKMTFDLGNLAWATALGGAIPAGIGAIPAGLGRTSRAVDKWATGRLVSEFVDPLEQQALADAGKGHVIKDLLTHRVNRGQGSDEVVRSLANDTHTLATAHEEFLHTTRDHPLTLDEARTLLDNVRSHITSSRAVADDIKPLVKAVESHDAVVEARTALKQAQATLKVARKGGEEAEINAAQRTVEHLSDRFRVAKASRTPLPKDKQLKEMSEALYKRINFRAPTDSPFYEQYLRAGREVARGRDMIFERMGAEGEAQAFRVNREKLSDHLALTESLSNKHIPDVKFAWDKAKSSAAVAGSLAALGLRGGGVLGGAATGGGMALLYYSGIRGIAAASRQVATRLASADARLANVIKAGLLGTSIPRVALHKYDYETEAAHALGAQRDPVTAYSNMHQALTKIVPEPVADRIAPRIHAIGQASAQALPKPPNTPDMASAAQPDLHQQRAWLSQHRSRLDPSYALAYPTPQNMQAAKQHHPETIIRAQEAVMDALAKNPYLPLASRMWAARVLGRPAGGLTSPVFYQSLSQMRAKADAEAQGGAGQGAPSRQRGNGSGSVAQSEQSRLGELSTGQ